MGHVGAILSSSMLVHGGRTAPDHALGDLWLLDLAKPKCSSSSDGATDVEGTRWVRVDAEGTPPSARHRHSAVSVGGSLKVGPWFLTTAMHVCSVLVLLQPSSVDKLDLAFCKPLAVKMSCLLC